MHDLATILRHAVPPLLCTLIAACRPVVRGEGQDSSASDPGTSATNGTSTTSGDISGTTPSDTSAESGRQESSSTTNALLPVEYSAFGADGPGFKYEWIQIHKYDPNLEYCLTVSLIWTPSSPQPGFDNTELWGIWQVDAAWARGPVAICPAFDADRTFATSVTGRIVPQLGEDFPCELSVADLAVELPPSEVWPSADKILVEDLPVEEAYWCN